jgi:hypothetical protein
MWTKECVNYALLVMFMLLWIQGSISQGPDVPEEVAPVPVHCTNGMNPVQNKFPITSNGCTGTGFIELEGEEDFTSCCDEHDACYQVCGMTKKRCDMKFWECLEHMCETVFTTNKQCRSAANIYYIATRTLGREFYEDAQSEHCQCVENEKVSEHYRDLISDFYGTYAPKSKSKFNWSKYADFSWPKLAALFNTLHEKYNKAIIHVGPRVGKKPPRSATRPSKKVDPWGEKPVHGVDPKKTSGTKGDL